MLVLEEMSAFDYVCFPEDWPFASNLFSMKVQVCPAPSFNRSLEEELFSVPLSGTALHKRSLQENTASFSKDKGPSDANAAPAGTQSKTGNGSQEETRVGCKTSGLAPLPSGPDGEPVTLYSTGPQFHALPEKVPRHLLMLSKISMILEGYPLPLNCTPDVADFVFSKEEYECARPHSPLYGVDCEMVTTAGGMSELARVSVVDEKMNVVYESLVKPAKRVTNYLTRYSGITKEMLKNVTTTLQDVQRDLRDLLPADAIWCGQSLNFDLRALKMFHPYCIDTSVIYNITGVRWKKSGLKILAHHFLNKVIQSKNSGHDSQEDAASTMELVLLKLRNSLLFGDCIEGGHVAPLRCYRRDPSPSKEVKDTPPTSPPQSPPTQASDDSESDGDDESSPQDHAEETADGRAAPEEVSCETARRRKASFFQGLNSGYCDSLFKLVHQSGKSACVIDHPSKEEAYGNDSFVTFEGRSEDKKVVSKFKEMVKSKDFLYAKLFKGAQSQASQKAMRKLDKRVKKVWKALPEDALFIVMLPGAMRNGQMDNGLCLMKLKRGGQTDLPDQQPVDDDDDYIPTQ